jgi:pimeloyl-ACP methyl ester carboxylesterase
MTWMVADVTGLLDMLGVDRAVIVGHDWGEHRLDYGAAALQPGPGAGGAERAAPAPPAGPADPGRPPGSQQERPHAVNDELLSFLHAHAR